MKKSALLILVSFVIACSTVLAQTAAFTYQGKLTDGGSNANGQYDFTFRLFTAVSGGSQVGADVTVDDVQVTAGVFTVNLNFGSSPFTSVTGNFLEILVRPGAGAVTYTMLAPRQPITSSPFSIKTVSVGSADSLSAACVLCITDAHIVAVDGANMWVVSRTTGNAMKLRLSRRL